MADKKIDLAKLKDEIHNRKQTKGDTSGGQRGTTAVKDEFLNGLVESLNTGRPSQATDKIRKVDVATSEKLGDEPVTNTNTNNSQTTQSNVQNNQPPTNVNSGERDHKLFEEFERKKKEMLGGGAMNYNHNKNVPSNSQPTQNVQSGNFINEDKLYETIDNVISNKFATVVEQAMKDSIVEIYAEARMKEVLEENEGTIKKIVIDVIRDLQSKKK